MFYQLYAAIVALSPKVTVVNLSDLISHPVYTFEFCGPLIENLKKMYKCIYKKKNEHIIFIILYTKIIKLYLIITK